MLVNQFDVLTITLAPCCGGEMWATHEGMCQLKVLGK